MATVIDSLIVSLGLDASQFTKGQKQAVDSLRKTGEESKKTGSQLKKDGEGAAEAFGKLKRELLSVLAVYVGIGAVKSFVTNTILSTASLGRLSQNLGMSAKDLAEWQLANKHAGGTVEGMTSAIKDASKEIADFKNGLEPSAAMQKSFFYNVDLSNVKTGTDLLKARAETIKNLREQYGESYAMNAAADMGISDTYNLMKNGADSVEAQRKAQEKLAQAQADTSDSAEKLRQTFDDLMNKLQMLGIKLLEKFLPALEKFAAYLDKPDFERNMLAFVDGVGQLADAVVKALRFLGILDAPHVGGFNPEDHTSSNAGGMIKDSSKGVAPVETGVRIVNKLISMGWTPQQAAGIAGSLQQESQFDPSARNSKSGAYGIGQWLSERRADFKKWAGKDIQGSSEDDQLKFMHYELTQGKEKSAGDLLRKAKSAADAAVIHRKYYERPGAEESQDERRKSYADYLQRQAAMSNLNQIRQMPSAINSKGDKVSSTSSTSETNINGPININTQATDSQGIVASIGAELSKYSFVPQANTGLV